MNLTQDNAGQRLSVRVGETVSIALAENPTTGYRWHADIDPTRLQQTEDSYDGPSEPRGAGGIRRLTFTTLRAGPTHLKLVQRRSWENAGSADFDLDLDIQTVPAGRHRRQ